LTHFWTKLFLAAPANFLSAAAFSHWLALSVAASVFTHFWIKLFLAAPASFLSAAACSHWLALALTGASLTHLPTKLVLAAPASFLAAARASHSCCAHTEQKYRHQDGNEFHLANPRC
jgi:hypothetical protein